MINWLPALALLCLTACAGSLFSDTRLQDALSTGRAAQMSASWAYNDDFYLLLQTKALSQQNPIHIYIEGDGFAYASPGKPSSDPTPFNPVALRLATQDNRTNIAWIARPCQYTKGTAKHAHCSQKYWTTHRMAPEIIHLYQKVLDQLLAKTKATQIELIGFSGGGAIAALLAAKRSDVVSLRTVAGNLDNAALIKHHAVSAMPDSLDAADFTDKLKAIPQIHYVGADDETVPPFLCDNFIHHIGSSAHKIVVQGTSHMSGWVEKWPQLLKQ